MVNMIYGVFANTVPSSAGNSAYARFSDFAPNGSQKRFLKGLMPADPDQRAVFTGYILKLLSCSPLWVELIQKNDPTNTYDVDPLYNCSVTLNFNPLEKLLSWEATVRLVDPEFPYSDTDPVIDRLCAKLAAVVRLKGDSNG